MQDFGRALYFNLGRMAPNLIAFGRKLEGAAARRRAAKGRNDVLKEADSI